MDCHIDSAIPHGASGNDDKDGIRSSVEVTVSRSRPATAIARAQVTAQKQPVRLTHAPVAETPHTSFQERLTLRRLTRGRTATPLWHMCRAYRP